MDKVDNNVIKDNIKEAEKYLSIAEPEIEKAKKAGIDIKDVEEKAKEVRKRVNAIKSVYLE